MAREIINLGSGPDTGTGDSARSGGDKINKNFEEVYGLIDILTRLDIIVEAAGFSLVGQDLTINANWEWYINNELYTNVAAVLFEDIALSASGNSRLVYVVPNNENSFTLIDGEETTGTPATPELPNGGMYVTYFVVTDSGIGTPAEPYNGDSLINKLDKGGYTGTAQELSNRIGNNENFKKDKVESSYYDLALTGVVTDLDISTNIGRSLNFTDAITELQSMYFDLGGVMPYDGLEIFVRNSQETSFLIKHEIGNITTENRFIFSFPDEQDLEVLPGHIIHFKLKHVGGTSRGKIEFVGLKGVDESNLMHLDGDEEVDGNKSFLQPVSGVEAVEPEHLVPLVQMEAADAATLTAANAYTDSKVTSIYKIKPSVADFASLPTEGNVVGDTRNTLDTGMNYVWDGTLWDPLGTTVDISGKQDLLVSGTNIKTINGNSIVGSGDLEIDSSSNENAGNFTGVFDVSQGNNLFYNDYKIGSVVDLSLSTTKTLGSTATVRIKGDLTGVIPAEWNLSGQPITDNLSKNNELTILYISDNDIRLVNRIVNFIDTEAPSVPTGLASSGLSDESVTLTWNAATDNISVANYKIRKDGVLISEPTGLTYNVTGLTPSTSYNFTVSAIDTSGNESAQSSVLVVETTEFVFQSEYQAFLDYGSTNGYDLPTPEQQLIDNNKVKYLKQVGAWNECDTIRIFNATYTPTSWATNIYRINLKSPGNFTLYADSGKELTFVSGSGFKKLSGTDNFGKTGFIPSSHAVKMTINSASLIVSLFDIPTTYSSDAYIYGGRLNSTSGNQTFIGNNGSGTIITRLMSGSSTATFTQSNVNSEFHIVREYSVSPSVNTVRAYINAFNSLAIGAVEYSPVLSTFEQYIGGINNNGTLLNSLQTVGVKYLIEGSGALESLRTQIYQIMNETYIP